jgi:hypothetical protein
VERPTTPARLNDSVSQNTLIFEEEEDDDDDYRMSNHCSDCEISSSHGGEYEVQICILDVLPCKIIVDRRFRGTCYLHHQGGSTSQKTNLNCSDYLLAEQPLAGLPLGPEIFLTTTCRPL